MKEEQPEKKIKKPVSQMQKKAKKTPKVVAPEQTEEAEQVLSQPKQQK